MDASEARIEAQKRKQREVEIKSAEELKNRQRDEQIKKSAEEIEGVKLKLKKLGELQKATSDLSLKFEVVDPLLFVNNISLISANLENGFADIRAKLPMKYRKDFDKVKISVNESIKQLDASKNYEDEFGKLSFEQSKLEFAVSLRNLLKLQDKLTGDAKAEFNMEVVNFYIDLKYEMQQAGVHFGTSDLDTAVTTSGFKGDLDKIVKELMDLQESFDARVKKNADELGDLKETFLGFVKGVSKDIFNELKDDLTEITNLRADNADHELIQGKIDALKEKAQAVMTEKFAEIRAEMEASETRGEQNLDWAIRKLESDAGNLENYFSGKLWETNVKISSVENRLKNEISENYRVINESINRIRDNLETRLSGDEERLGNLKRIIDDVMKVFGASNAEVFITHLEGALNDNTANIARLNNGVIQLRELIYSVGASFDDVVRISDFDAAVNHLVSNIYEVQTQVNVLGGVANTLEGKQHLISGKLHSLQEDVSGSEEELDSLETRVEGSIRKQAALEKTQEDLEESAEFVSEGIVRAHTTVRNAAKAAGKEIKTSVSEVVTNADEANNAMEASKSGVEGSAAKATTDMENSVSRVEGSAAKATTDIGTSVSGVEGSAAKATTDIENSKSGVVTNADEANRVIGTSKSGVEGSAAKATADIGTSVSGVEGSAAKATADIGTSVSGVEGLAAKATTDIGTSVSGVVTNADEANRVIGTSKSGVEGSAAKATTDIENSKLGVADKAAKATTDMENSVSRVEGSAAKATTDIGTSVSEVEGSAAKATTDMENSVSRVEGSAAKATTDIGTSVSGVEGKAAKATTDIGTSVSGVEGSAAKATTDIGTSVSEVEGSAAKATTDINKIRIDLTDLSANTTSVIGRQLQDLKVGQNNLQSILVKSMKTMGVFQSNDEATSELASRILTLTNTELETLLQRVSEFKLPQGSKGDKGDAGVDGSKGEKGEKGADGAAAPTVAIPSVKSQFNDEELKILKTLIQSPHWKYLSKLINQENKFHIPTIEEFQKDNPEANVNSAAGDPGLSKQGGNNLYNEYAESIVEHYEIITRSYDDPHKHNVHKHNVIKTIAVLKAGSDQLLGMLKEIESPAARDISLNRTKLNEVTDNKAIYKEIKAGTWSHVGSAEVNQQLDEIAFEAAYQFLQAAKYSSPGFVTPDTFNKLNILAKAAYLEFGLTKFATALIGSKSPAIAHFTSPEIKELTGIDVTLPKTVDGLKEVYEQIVIENSVTIGRFNAVITENHDADYLKEMHDHQEEWLTEKEHKAEFSDVF